MEKEKLVKICCFLGLTFVASFCLGRVAGLFFTRNFFDFLENFFNFLLNISLGLVFAGVVFCLPALFLTKDKIFLAVLLNCFGFLLGFWFLLGFKNLPEASLLGLFFICQFFFFKGVQKRAKKFVSFFPSDIFSPPLKDFLLTLSLAFSLSFYFALRGEVTSKEFVIPETLFEKLVKPASQIFQKSLEESLKRKVGEKFEENIGTREPKEVLKFLQEEAKETAGEGELRQKFGLRPEFFDLERSTLPELRMQIQNQVEPFLKYLPFLAALSLFLTLRIVVSFWMIFLAFLLPVVFKVLLRLKVLKIVEKQKMVERITF